MHKSTNHILTTHTGSLPRGAELNDLLIAEEAGEAVDKAKLSEKIDKRVAYVMEKQRWAGVDVANDGEQGRVGFQTYVPKRMHGFGGESKRPFGKEWIENPLYTEKFSARIPKTGKVFGCPECVSELKYHDKEAIKIELARYKKAASGIKPPFAEMFFAEPSPGIIATTMLNAHYSSYEAYLDAIAREMHYEYKAVVDAGLVLQIDAPDLAMERVLLFQDKTEAEYVKIVELHIATLNKALHDIPRDRVRLHLDAGQVGAEAHAPLVTGLVLVVLNDDLRAAEVVQDLALDGDLGQLVAGEDGVAVDVQDGDEGDGVGLGRLETVDGHDGAHLDLLLTATGAHDCECHGLLLRWPAFVESA